MMQIICINSALPYKNRFLTTLEDNAVNENEPDEGTVLIGPPVPSIILPSSQISM